MKPESVLVLDVGKTNKKAAVYDREFRVLAEDRISLGTAGWEGLEIERSEELLAWFRQKLAAFARDFDIRAISVSAHGATLALLDQEGALAMPVMSYTAPAGAEVQREFYELYGTREDLLRETGSADIGFCNMAKVLHYIRTRRPDIWERCRHGLFYSSYFAYELSGVMAMEPTFIGNHSYLWDFERKDWSRIARDLGADSMFAKPVRAPWDALGPLRESWMRDCGIGPACQVCAGIHDSNANLLPYLAREESDFILNSTGTWCVLMRPATSTRLNPQQVEAGVFFNQSAYGSPVLTGLLPAGMEYQAFSEFAAFADGQDEASLKRVATDRDLFVIPGTLPDIPLFPGAKPGLVVGNKRHSLEELKSGEAAGTIATLRQRYFAALNLALALATKRAMAPLAAPRGTRVYIEGGFADNAMYCRLLATLCPEYDWVVTRVKEGTAFGAALCGWAAADGVDPRELTTRYTIATAKVPPYDIPDLAAYARRFEDLIHIGN